jgi:hypothetical protein
MDQVTAQALTLFDRLAGIEGMMLNESAPGGMRWAKPLAQQSTVRQPPAGTEMISSQ